MALSRRNTLRVFLGLSPLKCARQLTSLLRLRLHGYGLGPASLTPSEPHGYPCGCLTLRAILRSMTPDLSCASPPPRRAFFRTLATVMLTPLIAAARREPTVIPAVIEPWEADADALARWRRAPRRPIVAAADARQAAFLAAIDAGVPIHFFYDGGSWPGHIRRVTPGGLIHVDGFEGAYLSGYCHTRLAERTFHLARIRQLERRPGVRCR